MNIKSSELREKYLSFFEEKNHKIIPSSSLIPENDPTVLFTMAGMHPLVPYLSGQTHPSGKRLVNCQKCIRTGDIDSVGDNTHCTFFEMLGNWSLGDYFKEDSIRYSYEFLTSHDYLNIPKEKLYFSVFEGNDKFPKDMESYNMWLSLGVEENHIKFCSMEDNFWILGSGVGPCGPDTEIFYDTGCDKCNKNCDITCSCGKYVEIWNNVFMQYYTNEDKTVTELTNKNVDTGLGLDRVLYILNGYTSVYDTDLFSLVKEKLTELSNVNYEDNIISYRVVMDHIRTATFILGDEKGITPSNTAAGYVLRRLIRRMIRHLKKLNIDSMMVKELSLKVIETYKDVYKSLESNKKFILDELEKETIKFNKTINDGMKIFNKLISNNIKLIDGETCFKLFDTYGFPLEITEELAKENNIKIDKDGFYIKFKEHQEKSRTASSGQFKGGLADNSYTSTKYHTLAHIMLACLKEMYGKTVIQKGCNITPERIRFDFSLSQKMTDEEKKILTNKVNDVIQKSILVTKKTMTLNEAKELGAEATFTDKYDEVISVYEIENISVEVCGGPHVNNTNELGVFEIQKEESSASGIRRIKGVLK